MNLNLLEKTELWVNEIKLKDANLTEMADIVAGVLGLPPKSVLVVDVRPNHITFDLLEKEIPQQNIMGKERTILEALAKVPGVTLTSDSYIHSNGILGLICSGVENADEVMEKVADITREIQQKVARRAIVHPTGFEVSQGLIQDTNTPYLKQQLEEDDYKVTVGRVIEDTPEDLFFCLSDALSRGFGLILTTGGVGAEDKDHTVEAIMRLDPEAAVRYIVKFKQGTGRHVKEGVRIGVGKVGPSLLVSLPGPHDEVETAAPVLRQGLREKWSKERLAAHLAAALAEKWHQKGFTHH